MTESAGAERAPQTARMLLAELVGTFALVFVGCGAIMVDAETQALGQVGIALAFGLVIAVMVYAVGPVSGGHFNPAVTLALASRHHYVPPQSGIRSRGFRSLKTPEGVRFAAAAPVVITATVFPWSRVPGYWLAQVSGALAAAAVLRGSLGNVADVGATQPSGSQGEAFLWELVLTFLLLFVITAVATGNRPEAPVTAGIAIGGTIAMASLVGGPISGASLNPARSLAPALVSGNLDALWIYLAAPALGAVLGSLAYASLRAGN